MSVREKVYAKDSSYERDICMYVCTHVTSWQKVICPLPSAGGGIEKLDKGYMQVTIITTSEFDPKLTSLNQNEKVEYTVED